jgi:hypothetical protein
VIFFSLCYGDSRRICVVCRLCVHLRNTLRCGLVYNSGIIVIFLYIILMCGRLFCPLLGVLKIKLRALAEVWIMLIFLSTS